jgi:hypothetical protein
MRFRHHRSATERRMHKHLVGEHLSLKVLTKRDALSVARCRTGPSSSCLVACRRREHLSLATLMNFAASRDRTHVLATIHPRNDATVAVDDECVLWSNAAGIFSLAKSVQGPFRQ